MNKYFLSFLLMLPLSFVIFAQDNESEEEIEEVVVTGIKSSLKDAIEIKRNNVGVVDALTAEDLGKFPDGNLAEALSRLVGVTTERSNDEGTKVSVRGLGPEFNMVTLNGRTMPTVPPQYGGGRSFNFGDISGHGVAAVEVYKSANAVLPTGGLGSTINMVTAKPIGADDGGAVSFRLNQHSKNVNGDDFTPELDFIYITNGEYGGNKWGFSISGSHQERHNREEGTNEITWLPSDVRGGTVPSSAVITSSNQRADGVYFYPESLAYKFKDNQSERDNLQTAFQYEWSNGLVMTIDYTASSTSFDFTGITTGSYFAGWNTTQMTINEKGAVISGTAEAPGDGDSFQNDFEYGNSSNNNKSIGINFDYQINDNLNLTLDYHDSVAGFKGTPGGTQNNILQFSNGAWQGWGWWPVQEASGYLRARSFDFSNQVGALSWEMDKSFQGTPINVTQFDGSDMGPRQAFLNYQDRDSDLNQLQLIGTWDNNDGIFMESLSSIEFGISQMDTTFSNQKWFNQLINGKIADGNPVMMTYAFMPDDVWTTVNAPDYLGSGTQFYYLNISKADALYWFGAAGFVGDFSSGDGTWWNNSNTPYTWPAECLANDAFDADGNPNGLGSNVGYDGNRTSTRGVVDGCFGERDSNGIITEELNSIFVNFNFDKEMNGMPVRAQIGLRYEDEERASTATTTVPTNTAWSLGAFVYGNKVGVITEPTVYTGFGDSDYLLPNINVSVDVNEETVVRTSLSKTIARPDLEQLDSTVSVGAFDPRYPLTLGTGNPNLQPYESINLDLAYEFYYAEGSYFALNYFRKEIKDYHGAGLNSGPFNGVRDVTRGPRGELIVPENDDALCQWTAPQGYWACGWSNAYDWAWLVNTGFTFGCNGSADCIPDPNTGNAIFIGNSDDPFYVFNLAQPVNKYDGTLDGFEVAIQHLFDNNFGVLANATFVGGDTDADPAALGEQFALPGFGDAANLSVFYEDDNWRTRLSVNYKGETYAGSDQYNPLYVVERAQVDFNTTYIVSENTQLFFEAINITDEEVELYSRYKEMTFLYQDHGPIVKAGFRVSF